jgi:hypothetical protein
MKAFGLTNRKIYKHLGGGLYCGKANNFPKTAKTTENGKKSTNLSKASENGKKAFTCRWCVSITMYVGV